MSYNEYFNDRYKGLRRKNYSTICDMIKNYLWESYDEGMGAIKDLPKFKSAYKLCESAYNDLKEYEVTYRYEGNAPDTAPTVPATAPYTAV